MLQNFRANVLKLLRICGRHVEIILLQDVKFFMTSREQTLFLGCTAMQLKKIIRKPFEK